MLHQYTDFEKAANGVSLTGEQKVKTPFLLSCMYTL
jgi:hypothetical protein